MRKFAETPLPTSISDGENFFRRILSDVRRHHIPSSRSCAVLHLGKRSALHCRPTRLCLSWSCWTGIFSGTSAWKLQISGGPYWVPQTDLQIPSITGLSCFSWIARDWVSRLIFQSLSGETPLWLEGNCTSLQQSVHCLFHPTTLGTQKAYEGPPPSRGLIYWLFDERGVAAAIRKVGSSNAQGSRRANHTPPSPSGRSRSDFPNGALQPLSCRSWHPSNLEELWQHPILKIGKHRE